MKDERIGVVCVVPEPRDVALLNLVGQTVVITSTDGTNIFAKVALTACVDDFGIDFDPKRSR